MKRLVFKALLAAGVLTAQIGLAQMQVDSTVVASLPAPAASLALADQLYALTQTGELWATAPLRNVTAGLSVAVPLSSCGGQVLAVTGGGQLWWGKLTRETGLSPLAGLACAPGGAVLAVGNRGKLVRIEAGGQASSRVALRLLPDARPRFADLRGDGDALLMVLAGPSERYRHGVLGDALEATELLAVDRHSLKVEERLTLLAPYVFEDWEARPLKAGGREVVALVRSGPVGGAALVVAGLSSGKLKILAAGPDFGQPQRWLAPMTDGVNLFAVHTPHIGGTLTQYTFSGSTIKAQPVSGMAEVSNHRIGQRFITGGVWWGSVWVGSQDGQRTLNTGGFPALSAAPSTPLLQTAEAAYLGLQDGRVVRLP